MRLEEELTRGIEAGLAPAPSEPETREGRAVTVPSHWWFNLVCRTCGHTFRRGDAVLVDLVARMVRHLEPGLDCAGGPGAEPSATVAEFAAGLQDGWPASVPLIRLAKDDWRVPRPGQRQAAPRCRYCAHTFRPGEHVVVCPCRVGDPSCGAAVHRDPARGLSCWERWQPDGVVAICPVAKTKVTDHG
ncbi:hypothetical protein [Acrocarpospora sp. B8E8]|uniref:hypothetical protein n=1 Tax=Acrocarpospora sp. B8E8 TaxID=3153572 RepID=UPI00325F2F06